LLKASRFLRFWRLMPNGEKLIVQSKMTTPPPCFLKTFSKLELFAKTLLTAERRTLSGGAFI
jgi:hypothetical protein